MKTLWTGSLARNTFTFCCTKCFFFVFVLGARITMGLEVAPEVPRAAMTAHELCSCPCERRLFELKAALLSPLLPGEGQPSGSGVSL